MIKAAFDISGLTGNNITGVGVYTTNLIRAISETGIVKLSGTYKISRFKNRKGIFSKLNIPINIPYIPFIYGIIPHDFDVFHGTDFWIPTGGRFKKIITIHDLAIYHEDMYSEERRNYSVPKFEALFKHSKPDHIIVVSDFIKNEFLNRFPHFEGRVTTIYHGSEHFSSDTNLKPLFDFPYVAYIGTIEARKNVLQLFKAFLIANEKYPDLHLVLAGGTSGYRGEEIMNEILSHPKADKVRYLGYLDSETARRMLSHSQMLVYPSLYEGFGFPILEGMKLKIPVVTSSFGAMKEIAGDAAFTVDTTNTEFIANAIQDLIAHQDLRQNYISKGIDHAASFSWAKCAKETIDVYQKVI